MRPPHTRHSLYATWVPGHIGHRRICTQVRWSAAKALSEFSCSWFGTARKLGSLKLGLALHLAGHGFLYQCLGPPLHALGALAIRNLRVIFLARRIALLLAKLVSG